MNKRIGYYNVIEQADKTIFIYDSKITYLLYLSLLLAMIGVWLDMLVVSFVGAAFIVIVLPVLNIMSSKPNATIKEYQKSGKNYVTRGSKTSIRNPLTIELLK